jgi:hypothetical protein
MVAGGFLRVRAHGFIWALCAALIFAAGGAEAARAAQTTTTGNQVQVWNVNTTHMQIGPPAGTTDYRNFVAYITDATRAPYVPDIVTLQEAGSFAEGSRASCTEFAGLLAWVAHHPYDCVETGQQGGAAVVFRTDRFTRETVSGVPAGSDIRNGAWVPELRRTVAGGTCSASGSNWRSIAVRLKDTPNPSQPTVFKRVNVGSFHFPTLKDSGGIPVYDADCAWDNMQNLDTKLASVSADMRIAAGDTNHADAVATNNNNTYADWEYWYRHSNFKTATTSPCGAPDLCWKDVMYQKWFWAFQNAGVPVTPSGMYGYMHAYEWSWVQTAGPGGFGAPTKTDRRDYIFVKTYGVALDSVNQPRTVQWQDAGGTDIRYSDHRGQGALLMYGP